ncbi:MAG: FHA domain-containing protein [Candidatus Thermoplasmatota archaeon]|nr:FHA domain-containing protein [Candidatus Thermoplasmatota archaeon]
MSEKMDQFDINESNYFNIIKNNITPLDLFIISKLNEGLSLDDIADLAEKEFDIKEAKKTITKRFKKLIAEGKPEEGIILKQNPQYLVNPSKLHNTISLVFIKADLDSTESKNLEIGVQNVFETIITLNNKPRFGNPIKQLFTITGWMYDYVGVVYENNTGRFHSFRNHLINEGIAKTVDIVPIDTDKGFLFNPVSTPDYKNFKRFLVHYRNRMNVMIDELHKNDVNSTKTMRFFDEDEFGLHVTSGKNKGEIYPIDVSELKIGRYYDNDIIIQDIAVSRRHAKITKIGNQYVFKDQSTNGSYVNDKQIIYDEIQLKEGDVIKIGKNTFKFEKLRVAKSID